MNEIADSLKALKTTWLSMIEKAIKRKEEVFGNNAREIMEYMLHVDRGGPLPMLQPDDPTRIKVQTNRVAEFVRLYLPHLYAKNPHRQVAVRGLSVPPAVFESLLPQMSPMTPPEQQQMLMQQRQMMEMQINESMTKSKNIDASIAGLLQSYLNYTPTEFGLMNESRLAITEALIKGVGVVWTELHQPVGNSIMFPVSKWDTVDSYVIDPDAKRLRDAKWIAKRCVMPRHEFAKRYKIPLNQIRSKGSSGGNGSANMRLGKNEGQSSSAVLYWRVWSKMGIGHYLPTGNRKDENSSFYDAMEGLGQYCYLCVSDAVDHPCSLPPEMFHEDSLDPEEVRRAVEWPIPLWADDEEGWPVSHLEFDAIPNCPYGMAPLYPGMGELKLINFLMGFLAGRIQRSCRDLILVADEYFDEVAQDIKNGHDLSLVRVRNLKGRMTDGIDILKFPEVSGDIWRIISAAQENFEKRVGLTPLMYGDTPQAMRSAEEAATKKSMLSVRPEDMSASTEAWQSRIAQKELFTARAMLGPEHVHKVFREEYDPMSGYMGPITTVWANFVYRPPESDADVSDLALDFSARVEAGSIRKPNIDKEVQDVDQQMQTLFGTFMGHFQQTGDPTQVNALLTKWSRARQEEPGDLLFNPAPPPPPQVPPPQGAQQQ